MTVYNRTSSKLNGRIVPNQVEQWICREGASAPIVDAQTYLEAQKFVEKRLAVLINYQVLDQLRSQLKREGRLSARSKTKTEKHHA
jgi:hypothetical protein